MLKEKSIRCGKSLQKRYMPRVRRSKIQPGRPRIREVLGRSVAPVQTTSAQVAEWKAEIALPSLLVLLQ